MSVYSFCDIIKLKEIARGIIIEKLSKGYKIGIVGGGNVGTALAVALVCAGYNVELVSRKIKGVCIDNCINYEIKGDFGKKTALVPTLHNVKEFSSKKDIIFICTKSYDALKVMTDVKKSIKKDGAIVTIQNSYWINNLKRLIDSKNSICMYLDIAFVTQDEITYVFNSGGITLGIYDREAFDIMNKVKCVLDKITCVHETHDLYGFLLSRNILNNTISSLGAISGMKLGDILNDRNGRYLFVKLITESIKIFNALHINVLPYNEQLNYYTFIGEGFRSALYRLKIMRVLRINNRNVCSSALVEIERGRKTEISVPMSSLIKIAEDNCVKVPYTTAIRDMIVEIENGKRRVNNDAFYDKKLLNIKEN